MTDSDSTRAEPDALGVDVGPGFDVGRGVVGAECQGLNVVLSRYWSGQVTRADQRRLFAHLRECAACKARYVADAEVAAAIARDGRVGRLEAQRRARHRWLQALGRNVPSRTRGLWVRTLLVPALLIVVLARPPAVEAIPRVRSDHGGYQIGERSLPGELKPQRLHRGDVIVAPDDAQVVLFDKDVELRVLGPGSLLVELPHEHRYRLGFGRFEVRGPHVLTTPFAVAEVIRGAATIELDSQGASVRVGEGEVRVVTAEGERCLGVGERLELGQPVASAASRSNDGL